MSEHHKSGEQDMDETPSPKRPKRWVQVLVVIAIVGIGIMLARGLSKRTTGPKSAKRVDVKQSVEVFKPSVFDRRFSVKLLGQTTPARQVSIQAEVAGLATSVHPQLVAGGQLAAGDILVEIEKSDYSLAIRQAQAQVEQAKVRVQEEEGRGAIAAREWALIGRDVKTSKRGKSLALREPQLRSARAALSAAQSQLERAKLALKRTTIRAPMNAVVLKETVEVGQRLGPGVPLATLAGSDSWWVNVSVPQRLLSFIDAEDVLVTVHPEGKGRPISGKVLRRLPQLDPVGKMVRLVLEVENPMSVVEDRARLFLNDTVEVQFHCRAPDVLALPRRALRAQDKLWVVDSESKLQVVQADVYWKDDTWALVRGLSPESVVVSSGLSMPTPGTLLTHEPPKQLNAAGQESPQEGGVRPESSTQ